MPEISIKLKKKLKSDKRPSMEKYCHNFDA